MALRLLRGYGSREARANAAACRARRALGPHPTEHLSAFWELGDIHHVGLVAAAAEPVVVILAFVLSDVASAIAGKNGYCAERRAFKPHAVLPRIKPVGRVEWFGGRPVSGHCDRIGHPEAAPWDAVVLVLSERAAQIGVAQRNGARPFKDDWIVGAARKFFCPGDGPHDRQPRCDRKNGGSLFRRRPARCRGIKRGCRCPVYNAGNEKLLRGLK